MQCMNWDRSKHARIRRRSRKLFRKWRANRLLFAIGIGIAIENQDAKADTDGDTDSDADQTS